MDAILEIHETKNTTTGEGGLLVLNKKNTMKEQKS